MSRKFCLLPQGFSEACALDCETRHRHLSLKEVNELEASGEIEFLDVHPATKKARYIQKIHGTQITHIPAAIMQTAAGAYKRHAGEVAWARRTILDYGRDTREFSRLVSQDRVVTLRKFAWNAEGVRFWWRDGLPIDAFPPNENPVRVALKSRTPESLEIVKTFLQLESAWKIETKFLPEGKSPPDRCEIRVPKRLMAKVFQREQKSALEKVVKFWPQIVAGFLAGPHSEVLNATPADELPSLLFLTVLTVYANQ